MGGNLIPTIRIAVKSDVPGIYVGRARDDLKGGDFIKEPIRRLVADASCGTSEGVGRVGHANAVGITTGPEGTVASKWRFELEKAIKVLLWI